MCPLYTYFYTNIIEKVGHPNGLYLNILSKVNINVKIKQVWIMLRIGTGSSSMKFLK